MDPKTEEVSDTPVEMMDVYQEFSELSEKFKIMKFKSKVSTNLGHLLLALCYVFTVFFTCLQKVDKNYCFEIPDIPTNSEYLEIRYSVSHFSYINFSNCNLNLIPRI